MKYEAPKIEAKADVSAEFGANKGRRSGGGVAFTINGS